MKLGLAGLAGLLCAGCVSLPPLPPVGSLLKDELFAASTQPIDAGAVLKASAAMKAFVQTRILANMRLLGPQMGLVQALYAPGELRLDYDATHTRTAAEAFDAKAGNCLSLVIMTAAMAKELGLPVRFQNVLYEQTWGRSGDLVMSIGHINLALGRGPGLRSLNDTSAEWLVVDFLPGQELSRQRTRVIDESRVLAMYMNNRAAESLALGQVDKAYWWARAALLQDPQFTSSYNTLGVVYRRHGHDAAAEQVFRHALQIDPRSAHPVDNLVRLLRSQGRNDEAQLLAQRLVALQPFVPFASFGDGMTALRAGEFARARALFETEIRRIGDHHELHYWLAMTLIELGEPGRARRHLEQALEHSPTREQRALYSARLDQLRPTKLQ